MLLRPTADDTAHNDEVDGPIAPVNGDVLPAFLFVKSVGSKDRKHKKNTGEHTMNCAVAESSEVVSILFKIVRDVEHELRAFFAKAGLSGEA